MIMKTILKKQEKQENYRGYCNGMHDFFWICYAGL